MSRDQHTFAFLIHPLDPVRDVARKYPALGSLPAWLIELLSLFYPPVLISEINGIRSSANGRTAKGWFIACPLSARLMVSLPPAVVYRKLIQSGRLAERLGARLLGLGAFSSVVGDGGVTVNNALRIPVTTGNSYTVATALQGVHLATARMNINLQDATVAVVGAAGAIGQVCARMLAPEVQRMILVGRHEHGLQSVAQALSSKGGGAVETTSDIERIGAAQVVISVTSALQPLIQPHHLQAGAVVCDVARPRDVARKVATERPDVLVFEGGVIKVPGEVDFGFDFGFPPGTAYACMAETMALTLERRFEPFTLGKELELGRVNEINRIATQHGFTLAGLRSFERALTEREVAAIARHRKQTTVTDRAAMPVVV